MIQLKKQNRGSKDGQRGADTPLCSMPATIWSHLLLRVHSLYLLLMAGSLLRDNWLPSPCSPFPANPPHITVCKRTVITSHTKIPKQFRCLLELTKRGSLAPGTLQSGAPTSLHLTAHLPSAPPPPHHIRGLITASQPLLSST